uniref:Uncharacterized protein n=1 Tax=Arundo donax TaxID=35708 RepID=A0A0A9DUU3_ARUDO
MAGEVVKRQAVPPADELVHLAVAVAGEV